MKNKDEILREFDEVIQYFIGHIDNEPKTEFCKNVDKLIDLKADLANVESTSHEQALNLDSVMPRRLTAENGAKGLLIGEFYETITCHDDEGESYDMKMPVEWDTIKQIYAKIVEHYGA